MPVHTAVLQRQVLQEVINLFIKKPHGSGYFLQTLRQLSIVQKSNNTRPGLVLSLGLMKQDKLERIFGM